MACGLLVAAIVGWLGPVDAVGQEWTVANLHPLGAERSAVLSVTPTQQGGYVRISGTPKAAVWSGSAATYSNLDPTGSGSSEIYVTTGNLQGGQFTDGGIRAGLWSGSAGSVVNMNPPGATFSIILDIFGTQQVGNAVIAGVTQAGIWSGSASSFVSLAPMSSFGSSASATVGNRQGGSVDFGEGSRASLWSGTSASRVSLHPLDPAITSSEVRAMSQTHQAGKVIKGGVNNAALWSGFPGSFVNLHPSGEAESRVQDLAGNFQVGTVGAGFDARAALWSGSASSFFNLQSVLGAEYTASTASAIWTDGGIVLIGGEAYNSLTGRWEAILWRRSAPPSRAPTVRILGPRRVVVNGARHVVRGASADADNNLARVEVKTSGPRFQSARGLAIWRFPVRLQPGRNVVLARAVDSEGNRSRLARLVIIRR